MEKKSTKRAARPMSFRERVTNLFSPEKGMQMYRDRLTRERKELAQDMLGMLRTASASGYRYHGASQEKTSLIGWITGGGSAEDDIDLQGSTLRIRSRDLYAGGGLGRAAPSTMTTTPA